MNKDLSVASTIQDLSEGMQVSNAFFLQVHNGYCPLSYLPQKEIK